MPRFLAGVPLPTVHPMSVTTKPTQCYLAEWYRSGLEPMAVTKIIAALEAGVEAVGSDGAPVRLIVTMAVPADEVLYVLFDAESSELVNEVCGRAGLPPQRLTAEVGAWFTRDL